MTIFLVVAAIVAVGAVGWYLLGKKDSSNLPQAVDTPTVEMPEEEDDDEEAEIFSPPSPSVPSESPAQSPPETPLDPTV